MIYQVLAKLFLICSDDPIGVSPALSGDDNKNDRCSAAHIADTSLSPQ
jgi:hypothetical protein